MSHSQVQEFLLQGSVLEGSRDLLLERLKGLSDPKSEEFREHQLIFHLRGQSGVVILHARRSIDTNDAPWHLRYIGNPEADVGRQCPTIVRKSVDSLAESDNLMEFLKELGFRMEYEFVAKGWIFTKGKLKITVTKIYKVLQPGNIGSIEPLTQSHFVELSLLSPAGTDVSGEIKAFAEQLKPIVQLEKFDYTQLLKS